MLITPAIIVVVVVGVTELQSVDCRFARAVGRHDVCTRLQSFRKCSYNNICVICVRCYSVLFGVLYFLVYVCVITFVLYDFLSSLASSSSFHYCSYIAHFSDFVLNKDICAQWRRVATRHYSNIVNGLTFRLRGMGCILYCAVVHPRRRRALRLDEPFVQGGCEGGVCNKTGIIQNDDTSCAWVNDSGVETGSSGGSMNRGPELHRGPQSGAKKLYATKEYATSEKLT